MLNLLLARPEGARGQPFGWSQVGQLFSWPKPEPSWPHSIWKPESYMKLEDGLPEAAHFEKAKWDFNLTYDPIHDEYVVSDLESAPVNITSLFTHTVVGVVVGIYAFRTLLLTPWRGTTRRMITMVMGSAPPAVHNYSRLRKAFTSTEFFQGAPLKEHSHGIAAGHRVAVNRFISHLCTTTGLEQYSFQMCSREQKVSMRGNRTYFWAKDINAFPQFDQVEKCDFVSMVDVDYYLDMPSHLAEHPQPHVLYTLQPETAGRIGDDYSYCFDGDGNINFSVTGGATYKHPIWNYGVDWFTASSFFFGIPYRTVIYDVQTKRTSPDKQVVLLSPIRVTTGLASIFAYIMGRSLERLNPHKQGFSKVCVANQGERTVSVARAGFCTSATIPRTVFESLLSTKSISPKTTLNLYQVKAAVAAIPGFDKDLLCPILCDFLNNTTHYNVPEVQWVETPKLTAVAYEVPDPNDKPLLEPFCAPFVPPAFVPLNNKASSDQSIKGRVLLPRTQAEEILGGFKMTPTKLDALTEFVQRLVPVPHAGVPLDYLDIALRQTKPGQKKDLEEAGFWTKAVTLVKTFLKREAYGKPPDPRNITTFNPLSKIKYAAFIYPLMDHVKTFPFYAFGRSPLEVANSVARIASGSNTIDCPDISRMDGFVNEFCRQIEAAVANRFFQPAHLDAFHEAHSLAYGNRAVTTHGTRYDQEFSRGSGEMGTSLWNTIENLFICFYARYLQTRDYQASWDYLLEKVLAGGDDGLLGDSDPKTMIRAARDVGFILKCPTYQRGDTGVNFLARIYGPGVWFGEPDSMCSLKRQLEKFHLTAKNNLPPLQKLYEKSLSFALTDSSTPVIGPLVKKVLSLNPGLVSTGTCARYGDDWDISVQYPNEYAPWMQQVAEDELPLLRLSELTLWIESVTTLEQLLDAPVFYDEGREYTYDDWDPTPGLLIAKTLAVFNLKPVEPKVKPAAKKTAPPRAVDNVDVNKVTFGSLSVEELKAPAGE